MLGFFFGLSKMIEFIQQIFAKFFNYISSFFNSLTEPSNLKDNRDNHDGLCMQKIELQELQAIINYFKEKK